MQRLLPITTTRTNRRTTTFITKRLSSKGSLGGGFTQQGLQQFANRAWNETQDQDPYTDLFHIKLSAPCNTWLDSHDDPSAELGKAFFGSTRFYPERMLLTPFLQDKKHLPEEFREGDKFLAWEVTSKSPLELICSWNLGNTKGFTMMAFDPKLRRLYHGSCVDRISSGRGHFKLLIPFHVIYAKFLLHGMKNVLENKVHE
jgi:hypothetical protein